jgi:ubiquinone/menaquinone biosynthesis C-methylase UbiE
MAAVENLQLWDPRGAPVCAHSDIYESLLPLKDAHILDLGCGDGETSRAIATDFPRTSIVALEVDTIQHDLNCRMPPLENLEFALGGAEKIPAEDDSFDIVMMVKSLHHVPVALMGQALREVRRVLRPGGLAYIAEPVFGGAFNEILRVFHDEEQARLAAFAAVTDSIKKRAMELVAEKFFLTPLHLADFAAFEQRYINVTHSPHSLSKAQQAEVRKKFDRHMTPKGARFQVPMRVNVLRKAA